jgi:hypothetical protein
MRFATLLLGLAACSSDPAPTVDRTTQTTAALALDTVTFRGTLAFGTPVDGQLAREAQLDGYFLDVRDGATVKLEITHGGSSLRLDTTLAVYGPADLGGNFPDAPVAFDDDAGYGKLSKLTVTLAAAGRYAVVVANRDVTHGRYRLVPTCASSACAPLPAIPLGGCPAPLLAAMQTCVAANHEPYDPLTPRLNAAEACADADVLAPIYDATCPGAAHCLGTFEAFYTVYAPACTRDGKNAILDGWCVFGTTYRDIAAQPSMTLTRDLRLTAASPISAVEGAQIISALHASSHDEVTTVAEAFAAAQDHEIFQRHWWDASARRAYTSYEYGAGDNSYGRIFALGVTAPVADITDGDIYPERCTARYGAEQRDCSATIDCKSGTRCTGIAEDLHRGTCVNPSADTSPFEGSACSASAACPLDSGLLCAGLSRGVEGLCLPAWQRRAFVTAPELAIPDNRPAGATATIYAYGLATVDMDVWLALEIDHPRPGDLAITLENPAGAVATVPIAGGPIRGFSGDESVNGAWKLRIVDGRSGQRGTLRRAVLTLGSRWD